MASHLILCILIIGQLCCLPWADKESSFTSSDQERTFHHSEKASGLADRHSLPKALHSEVARYEKGTGKELGKYVANTVQGLSKGLKFIVKIVSTTSKVVGNFSRFALITTARTSLFQKSTQIVKLMQNKTTRESTFTSAWEVAVSICSKTPDVLHSASIVLDSSAQYSLEVNALSQSMCSPFSF
jgi:hypothetical protein